MLGQDDCQHRQMGKLRPGGGACGVPRGPVTLCLSPVMLPPARPAVFDFHQAVDGLQEVQRQAQEGKK